MYYVCYSKFTSKQKATIGNYAVLRGPSDALRYFKKEFPELKWSMVIDWKNAIIMQKRINASWDREPVDVVELVSNQRGKPSTLLADITSKLMENI